MLPGLRFNLDLGEEWTPTYSSRSEYVTDKLVTSGVKSEVLNLKCSTDKQDRLGFFMTQIITVNNNNINLLFDSGANVSLVLYDVASKCEFDVKSDRTNDLSTDCGGKFVLKSEYKSDLGVKSISSKPLVMWGAPYITSACPKYSTEVIKNELNRKFPEFRTEFYLHILEGLQQIC